MLPNKLYYFLTRLTTTHILQSVVFLGYLLNKPSSDLNMRGPNICQKLCQFSSIFVYSHTIEHTSFILTEFSLNLVTFQVIYYFHFIKFPVKSSRGGLDRGNDFGRFSVPFLEGRISDILL